MDFKKKRTKGQNQKVRRTWLSNEQYRIVWQREAFGIAMPPRFQATVRLMLPNGQQMWDFCGRRLCKTFKAAVETCEHHYTLWLKAAEATGIRTLQELFGRVPLGYPIWVRSKLNRKVYSFLMDTSVGKRCEMLTDTCNDHPAHSGTFDTSATVPDATKAIRIPASPVKEPDQSSIDRSTRNGDSTAKSAKARGGERKKRAVKPTAKRSKNIGKKQRNTRGSGNSEKKPTGSSPKKRSQQLGN